MKASTHAIIGFTVVALGVGVFALGMAEGESNVRQLWDVLDEPETHRSGDYVLIGIPQPATLEGPDGPRPNPERANETRTVTAWQRDGVVYQSTHTVRATPHADGTLFTYENRTQVQGDPSTRDVTDTRAWNLTTPHTLFLIQGFPDDNGVVPMVWGVYEGTLRDPVQPKPSQFEGRMATEIAGQDLPPFAHVFQIDEYTAGCSSKFIPDDHEAPEV